MQIWSHINASCIKIFCHAMRGISMFGIYDNSWLSRNFTFLCTCKRNNDGNHVATGGIAHIGLHVGVVQCTYQ